MSCTVHSHTDYYVDFAKTSDEDPNRRRMAEGFGVIVRNTLKPHSNSKVLDFGCGTGRVGMQFTNFVERVVFLDISPAMIEVLRSNLQEAGIENYEIFDNCIEELQENDFDLILAAMALHQIADTEGLFVQMYQHLAPGGSVVFTDLCKNEEFFTLACYNMPHHGFNPVELKEMLLKVGFSDVSDLDVPPFYRKDSKGVRKPFARFGLIARK